MKKMMILFGALFLGAAAFCQDADRNRGNVTGASVQEQLKKKDPEAWAEVEKLAKTDLFAAMEKLRAAAGKNQIALPRGQNRFNRGRRPDGEGFGRGRRPDGEGFGRGRRSDGEGQQIRQDRTQVLEILKKRDAAGFAAYEKAASEAKQKQQAGLESAIAAEKVLTALAAKHKSELPETRESLQIKTAYLRAKYASEFPETANLDFRQRMERMRTDNEKLVKLAEKEGLKLDFSAMMPGFRGGFPGRPEGAGFGNRDRAPEREGNRANHMETMRRLQKKYPEEMKKFNALKAEGKQKEAQQLLRSLMKQDRETGK